MLVFTDNNIITIDIRDNNDYIISDKIENKNLFNSIFDFNTNLDLLCLNYEEEEVDEIYEELNEYIIKFFSFSDYNKAKFEMPHEIEGKVGEAKLQFLNGNFFFLFSSGKLESFSIKKNELFLEKIVKVSLDSKTSSIIDFNSEFYCLYDKYKILLLNKENLVTERKIEINLYTSSNILGILKLSDKLN